jgi:hypothetical protein
VARRGSDGLDVVAALAELSSLGDDQAVEEVRAFVRERLSAERLRRSGGCRGVPIEPAATERVNPLDDGD